MESRYVEIFRMANQQGVRHLPSFNTAQNALATQTAVSYIFMNAAPLNLKLFFIGDDYGFRFRETLGG
jgi:hypothetical protein